MSTPFIRMRHAFVVAAMSAALAAPLSAQANTNSTSTTTTTGGTVMTDTARTTTRDNDGGFPWGLLGLLGLAGLLGRRKVDTTVHHDTTRAARPGDPNYRV